MEIGSGQNFLETLYLHQADQFQKSVMHNVQIGWIDQNEERKWQPQIESLLIGQVVK
jgi:hypothetical protein